MIRELLDDFLQAVAVQFDSVPTMIGFPVVGRDPAILPSIALEFVSLDELTEPKPMPRLGQTARPGLTISVTMHVFANVEPELLELLDSLIQVRTTVVRINGTWNVVYQTTQRYTDGGENPYLKFAMMTPVSLSTVNFS